jgi:AcrR family transcriptional regulator
MQRRTRTRGSLAQAALELAASGPLADITVTALAERAGITRETVYRHTAGVAEAVAAALGEELRVIQEENSALPAVSGTGDSVFRTPTRQLVEHLVARAPVYRNAMAPRLHPRVREVLTEYIAAGLAVHLEAHPEIAPAVGAAPPDAFGRAGLVAYAAAGTVGVLEEWLATDEPVAPEELTELILAAAPEWWQGRAGAPRP